MEPTYPTAAALLTTAIKKPEPAAPTRPAYPTLKESWAALGWYLLAMLAAVVPLVVLMAVQQRRPADGVGVLLGQLGHAGLIWWLLRRAGRRRVPAQWGRLRPLLPVLALLVPLTLCVSLSLTPTGWLGLPSWGVEQGLQKMMRQPGLAFVLIGVLAPVLEEWLFRGVLLPGPVRGSGWQETITQVPAWEFAAIGAALVGTAAGLWYLRRLTPAGGR